MDSAETSADYRRLGCKQQEGQARRLQQRDVPSLDRPLRFTVVRGKRPAIRAATLEELRRQLSELPRQERARLIRGGRRPRRR